MIKSVGLCALLVSVIAYLGAESAGQQAVSGPPQPAQALPRIQRFALLGSQGKGDAGQLEVAAAIQLIAATRGLDEVILLGDNILDNGVSSVSDPQWQTKFELPYAGIPLSFYAVLGNHDYGAGGAGSDFPKGATQVAYSNVSSKWEMPAAYYHRSTGLVHFVALDTNMQLYGMDAQQKIDVAAWLAASSAPWTIVLGHHDYLSNGEHGNAGMYDGVPIPPFNGVPVKNFLQNIVAGKADVYFSANDRSLQWMTGTLGGTQLIISGAGASTQTLPGNQPTKFQAAQKGFVYCVAEPKRLTIEFIGTAGQTLHSGVITKP